jgi:endonuclease I
LLTSQSLAQSIQISPLNLNFGLKTELNRDSLPIQISNTGNSAAHLSLSIPFSVYGSHPFSVSDSLLEIPAGESKTVWIRCQIRHNTPNPAALIIKTPWSESGGDHCISLACQGRYSQTYYNASENLDEEALKQGLKTITGANYNGFSYDVARDKMYGSIDNINDSVTCIYTGRKARFNTRAGAVTNNFNCEHTFPQSLFNQDLPMRSDLHHLFSTDDAANNSRGNLPFGVAVPPLVAVSTNAPSKNGGGLYEPHDGQKGATARAMIYFVTRYQDYASFFAPQESVLLKWHRQFPPSLTEISRNQAIFNQQANRNPFVDYPQFADRIHSFAVNSQSIQTKKLMVSDSVLYSVETGNNIPQNLQVVLWNEGNQPVQVQNIRFKRNYFLVNGSNNLSLSGNSAVSVLLNWNPDSSFETVGPDSLVFNSNDPTKPFVKLPWKKQNQTVMNALVKNPFRVTMNSDGQSFSISGDLAGIKSVSLRDLSGRKLAVMAISEGLFRIPSVSAGLYFLTIRSQNNLYTIPLRNLPYDN